MTFSSFQPANASVWTQEASGAFLAFLLKLGVIIISYVTVMIDYCTIDVIKIVNLGWICVF